MGIPIPILFAARIDETEHAELPVSRLHGPSPTWALNLSFRQRMEKSGHDITLASTTLNHITVDYKSQPACLGKKRRQNGRWKAFNWAGDGWFARGRVHRN